MGNQAREGHDFAAPRSSGHRKSGSRMAASAPEHLRESARSAVLRDSEATDAPVTRVSVAQARRWWEAKPAPSTPAKEPALDGPLQSGRRSRSTEQLDDWGNQRGRKSPFGKQDPLWMGSRPSERSVDSTPRCVHDESLAGKRVWCGVDQREVKLGQDGGHGKNDRKESTLKTTPRSWCGECQKEHGDHTKGCRTGKAAATARRLAGTGEAG